MKSRSRQNLLASRRSRYLDLEDYVVKAYTWTTVLFSNIRYT